MKVTKKKIEDLETELANTFYEDDGILKGYDPTQEELDFEEQYDVKFEAVCKEVGALIEMMSQGMFYANFDEDFFFYSTTLNGKNYTINFLKIVGTGYTDKGIVVKDSNGEEVLFQSDGKYYGHSGIAPIDAPGIYDCFFAKWEEYKNFVYEKTRQAVKEKKKSKRGK